MFLFTIKKRKQKERNFYPMTFGLSRIVSFVSQFSYVQVFLQGMPFYYIFLLLTKLVITVILTLLHSEGPKLYTIFGLSECKRVKIIII